MSDYDSSLLEFYAESGVEWLVGEEVVDYTALVAAPIIAKQTPIQQAQPSQVIPFKKSDEVLDSALAAANSAKTLDELKQALLNFEGLSLKKTAKQLVFAEGNPQAPLMIIGEAASAEDDAAGLPFQGLAGEMLNKMLLTIGLKREEVYLTQLIPWRPPGNRAASIPEIAALLPFMMKHIELAAPKVMFFMGGSVAQNILKTDETILKIRGKVKEFNGIKTISTLSPLYLMRQPLQKKLALQDLLLLKKTLNAS